MAKKKAIELPEELRWEMLDSEDAVLSISSQCALLNISRSTYYYTPVGESILNLELMRLIDDNIQNTHILGAEGCYHGFRWTMDTI